MNALTPLAVANADVLRAIQTGQHATRRELAGAVNRDESNLGKSLKALEAGGLITSAEKASERALTDTGTAALAAIERAENPLAAPAGFVELLHAQIIPDPANVRCDWASEDAKAELAALADSIDADGLLHPLIVGAADDRVCVGIGGTDKRLPMHTLIGGERRWRAIDLLIEDGRWSSVAPIPCQVRTDDGLAREYIALADNLQRRALNPIEEARAFARLRKQEVETTEIARRVGVTVRQVQLRLQLLELDEADQVRMALPKDHADYLSPTAARGLLQEHKERPATPVEAPATVSPSPPAFQPSSEQLLILAELREAARRESKVLAYGWSVKIRHCPHVPTNSPLGDLIGAGLISFSNNYSDPRAVLTHAGEAAVTGSVNILSAPAKQLAALREQVLGPVELAALGEDDYATAWLNQPKPAPPPPPMPAAQRLVLMEMMDRVVRFPAEGRQGAEVANDRPADAYKGLGQFIYPAGPGEHTGGRSYYSLYAAKSAIGLTTDAPEWAKRLREVRVEVVGEKAVKALPEGIYLTKWLNGPFEPDPTITAEVAAKKAAEAAALQARTDRLAAIAGLEREALTGVPFGFDTAFARHLAQDHPLPWRWDGDESSPYVIDAGGEQVPLYFGRDACAFARLLIIAANAAAGLATPPPSGTTEPDSETEEEDA